jgi:outer membrane assembly lipoprotein YfiO
VKKSIALSVAVLAFTACTSAPPFDGLSADEIYGEGLAHYEAGEYRDAIKSLEHLLVVHAGYPQAGEARYYLSKSFHGNGDYLSAVSEYIRILNRGVGDTLVPMASLGICEAYTARSPIAERDQTYTLQALTSCTEVVRDHIDTPYGEKAMVLARQMEIRLAEKDLKTAEFYANRNLLDSAIEYFEDVVTRYPSTPMAPIALQRIYESYLEIGYQDLADEAKQRLLDRYPDSTEAAAVRTNGTEIPGG